MAPRSTSSPPEPPPEKKGETLDELNARIAEAATEATARRAAHHDDR